MIFNEFTFLFLFLPIVLLLFYAPFLKAYRQLLLIVASLLFYGVAGIEHLVILIFDIAWVYGVTRLRRFPGNPLLLTIAIVPPLLALGYYKYLGFIIRSLGFTPNSTSGAEMAGLDFMWDIALPAGISFFTFQAVSYAIDCYKKQVEVRPSASQFALYITFFPQLVAGPIVRYDQVSDALSQLRAFSPTQSNFFTGIVYMTGGLAMKVLIADGLSRSLAPLVDAPDVLNSVNFAYLVFGYSFQIYFDFYGYSLIAIGLALLFGVRLPSNFMQPYSAMNPQDFWRRWHMSLSYWIRDYLYKPLGGNTQYIRNILIIFAVCGLWHGAAWTFVIWGLYHAALVILYKLGSGWWNSVPRLLQIAVTFILVSLGWLLFVFDFYALHQVLSQMATGFNGLGISQSPQDWVLMAIAAAVCWGIKIETLAEIPPQNNLRSVGLALLCVISLAGTLMFVGISDSFIYFRF
jgi:alginate O-acetyltransferase complex protein AlgI